MKEVLRVRAIKQVGVGVHDPHGRGCAADLIDKPPVIEPRMLPNTAIGCTPDERSDHKDSEEGPDKIRSTKPDQLSQWVIICYSRTTTVTQRDMNHHPSLRRRVLDPGRGRLPRPWPPRTCSRPPPTPAPQRRCKLRCYPGDRDQVEQLTRPRPAAAAIGDL